MKVRVFNLMRYPIFTLMTQTEMAKIQSHQLAFRVQLLEPDFILRYIGFTDFVSTWLIRRAEPKGLHPTPLVEYVCYCRTRVSF